MRFAVIGAGAVGSWYAALLTRAGNDVTVVARGSQLQALSQGPLKVDSAQLGAFAIPLRVVSDPADVAPVDVVLVAVKSQDIEGIAGRLGPLLGPDTIVITQQNGVDAPELIGAQIGRDRVWPGCVYLLSKLTAPGMLVQAQGPNRFEFGNPAGDVGERGQRLAEVLHQAGIPTTISPRILISLWEKFGIIAGWNGVLSVMRQPLGVVYADPIALEFLRGTIEESHEVGRARGIGLAPDLTDRQIAFMATFPPGSMGSMANDLLAQRPLELEALNGAVVRLGREVRVPTPLNYAIYASLRPYRFGAQSQQVVSR